jgi:hypothetical protein
MTNSKIGKSFSNDWKKKLKRLVADKNQQEVMQVIEEAFNAIKDNPCQLKLFKLNLN